MAFTDITILKQYKTYKNNIVKEFYNPVLSESVLYQRSVGFFSSSALIEIAPGLTNLARNGGKVQLIVSPYLTEEDIIAINSGYEKREIIERSLNRNISKPETSYEKECLNLLANLIIDNVLDIKVAFTPPNKKTGMYHEKVGILTDKNNNVIAFTGSLNETINAFYNNYESIVVFTSWEEFNQYVIELQNDFNSLWNNNESDIEVIDIPKVIKDLIVSEKTHKIDYENFEYMKLQKDPVVITQGYPAIPPGFSFHEYQDKAIEKWLDNKGKGIFDMATGTGKTYTGLGAAVRLFEIKKRLAIIIVCPYQHLVEQWVEDIEYFNMLPTIGYSSSKQRDWKKRLDNDIYDFSLGILDTFCFVTTNATFSSNYVRECMKKLGKDTLLIVDEAHNFGSSQLRNTLTENIEYRLALSATIDRHGDPEGTQVLKRYFGDKCIEYDLKRAIKEKKLTPYYYYPVVVYLSDKEIDDYRDLSYLISKEVHEDKNKRIKITEKGKILMLKRARLIAGAEQKIPALKEKIKDYKDDTHILVYCGATKMDDFTNDNSDRDLEGERQIVTVSKMLGNELGMKVCHFTSNESAEEREMIKKQFATATPYQALIAIKCLDEGVNIPSIRTAFILASTTNPKEYIQRRGRVLRLANNKDYAVIYDFVTLVKPLDDVDKYSKDYKYERALAKRELSRIKEFGSIAINNPEINEIIKSIEETYSISEVEEEKESYGDE